jgi:hypothetical protein
MVHFPVVSGHEHLLVHHACVCCVFRAVSDDVLDYETVTNITQGGLFVAVLIHVGATTAAVGQYCRCHLGATVTV